MVAVGWVAAACRPLGTGIDLAAAVAAAAAAAGVSGCLSACLSAGLSAGLSACCRSCRAAIISGGGCSWGRCEWWPVAWIDAGAGVTGRPTARGLLVLPVAGPPALTLPSPCRINRPIDPSFFFVVGIILNRIGSGGQRRGDCGCDCGDCDCDCDLERNDWRRVAVACGDCLLVYVWSVDRRCNNSASWRPGTGSQLDKCQMSNVGQQQNRAPARASRDPGYVVSASDDVGLAPAIRRDLDWGNGAAVGVGSRDLQRVLASFPTWEAGIVEVRRGAWFQWAAVRPLSGSDLLGVCPRGRRANFLSPHAVR